MLTVYLAALVIGGVFVLLSALGGGGHDGDADSDADHGLEQDSDHDTEAHADGDAGEAGHADVWVPFLSMRFWTYFLAFFGLTGVLLDWVWQGGVVTGLVSGGMGVLCGLGMAYGTRYFKRSVVSSNLGPDDLVGSLADVVVGLAPGQLGQIRCMAKGRTIELLARADDAEKALVPRGARVLIIDFDGETARVVGAPDTERTSAPAVAERSEKGA